MKHSRVPEYVETSDWAIVGRVVTGEIDAFELLVRRYHDRCLRYANRMLGDDAEARDVVQETFVRAYRSLPSYRDDGRFDAWLFQILLNRCRTAAARGARHRKTFVPLEPLGLQTGVEACAEDVLLREAIGNALGTLKHNAREAFLLKYVEGLSYEEIALLTGHRVSALKMRVKRARDELKMQLEGIRDA